MAGRVLLDWEDYDAVVLPYLTGRPSRTTSGCGAWPMPFGDAWPDREITAGPDSEDYSATALAIAAESRQHLGKKPALRLAAFRLAVSRARRAGRVPRGTLKLSRTIRMADRSRRFSRNCRPIRRR